MICECYTNVQVLNLEKCKFLEIPYDVRGFTDLKKIVINDNDNFKIKFVMDDQKQTQVVVELKKGNFTNDILQLIKMYSQTGAFNFTSETKSPVVLFKNHSDVTDF